MLQAAQAECYSVPCRIQRAEAPQAKAEQTRPGRVREQGLRKTRYVGQTRGHARSVMWPVLIALGLNSGKPSDGNRLQ